MTCSQRKNDREVIRRRLAMNEEDDYFSSLTATRPIRKPGNLQSRLQKGLGLKLFPLKAPALNPCIEPLLQDVTCKYVS